MTRLNPPGVLQHFGFTRVITLEGPIRLAFFAGQTPQSDDFGCIAPGDFSAQYSFVMDKLALQLSAVGAGWNDVFVRRLYLTDWDAWLQMRRSGIDTYFGELPASTAIGVKRLAHPDFMVEVEIIAALPNADAASGPSPDKSLQKGTSMKMTRINPPGVLEHPGFTRIITVEGPAQLVWMAGQTPQTDDFGCVAPGDFKTQYEFVMDKLEIQLEAVGATWDNVVMRKLYLVEPDSFRNYSRGPDFKRYFNEMPCSTAIYVTRLSHPDFLVEVELLVALPSKLAA